MAALTAQALAALISACTPTVARKPIVPQELVASIAQGESALDPLAIHDNATGDSFYPANLDNAAAIAKRLIAEGHRPDLGLMQVTVANLKPYHLTVEAAFDPCQSVRVGAQIYAAGLSRYNTGSPTAGLGGYVPRIGAAAEKIIPALHIASTAPSPEGTAPSDDPCAGAESWCASNQETP